MSKTVLIGSCALRVAAGLLFFAALSKAAFAVDVAPEVDPGSMASAVALLAAGGMFVADRFLHKPRARAK